MIHKALKIIAAKLGEIKHNPNAKRIWLEGEKLNQAGFAGGSRYSISEDGQHLVINLAGDGSYKVSERRGKPIIDIASRFVSEKFRHFTRVKVVIQENRITVMPDPLESNIAAARQALQGYADGGEFPMVDVFTGGATSSTVIHHATGG